MIYCLNLKKVLWKAGSFILAAAAIILGIRYIVMPYLFPKDHVALVEKYAKEYNVDENLVYSVIFVESGFDENAVSIKDAKGLMQLTDLTSIWGAEQVGIDNFTTEMVFEPDTNIHIGCWYLGVLTKQYNNQMDTAIAAYNAGSGNVSRWLKEEKYSKDQKTLDKIPFEETKKYVLKVNLIKKIYDYLY